MTPFERIVHYSDPVVTTAIEAKHTKDLPKLVEVLRAVSKADPSIQIDSNLETGEHLMSGMGELHLEITEYRIRNEHGVKITTSPPIVVYRETVTMKSPGEFEGKSPNKPIFQTPENRDDFFGLITSLPSTCNERGSKVFFL